MLMYLFDAVIGLFFLFIFANELDELVKKKTYKSEKNYFIFVAIVTVVGTLYLIAKLIQIIGAQ